MLHSLPAANAGSVAHTGSGPTLDSRTGGPQLAFFIKRWCSDAPAEYSSYGLDDNSYKSNNFAYADICTRENAQ